MYKVVSVIIPKSNMPTALTKQRELPHETCDHEINHNQVSGVLRSIRLWCVYDLIKKYTI